MVSGSAAASAAKAVPKHPFNLLSFSSSLRNLFPSNLVAAAFRSVSVTSFPLLFLSACVSSRAFVPSSTRPPLHLRGLQHPDPRKGLLMRTCSEAARRQAASFSGPFPAVSMVNPFHSRQPSNPPWLAALEHSSLCFPLKWKCRTAGVWVDAAQSCPCRLTHGGGMYVLSRSPEQTRRKHA